MYQCFELGEKSTTSEKWPLFEVFRESVESMMTPRSQTVEGENSASRYLEE